MVAVPAGSTEATELVVSVSSGCEEAGRPAIRLAGYCGLTGTQAAPGFDTAMIATTVPAERGSAMATNWSGSASRDEEPGRPVGALVQLLVGEDICVVNDRCVSGSSERLCLDGRVGRDVGFRSHGQLQLCLRARETAARDGNPDERAPGPEAEEK